MSSSSKTKNEESAESADDAEISIQEFTDAIQESLHRKGVLNKMRAMLRANIMDCLEAIPRTSLTSSSTTCSDNNNKNKNNKNKNNNNNTCKGEKKWQTRPENTLINELILEYLEFNGYDHTVSVLSVETNHAPKSSFERLDRMFIEQELGICQTNRKDGEGVTDAAGVAPLPMLYVMVEALKRQKSSRFACNNHMEES